MIKNLHPNGLSYFLTLFNAILLQSIYPSQWKLAIVLPIPKPSKDPSSPDSYRSIALASVLDKLFQKILNKRFIWYLESNDILSPSQYGFRKGQNTLQALTVLHQQMETVINANSSSLYTIFFDLEQAFPHVWRHYNMSKITPNRTERKLPKSATKFPLP